MVALYAVFSFKFRIPQSTFRNWQGQLFMDDSEYFSFDNRLNIYYKCITLLTN